MLVNGKFAELGEIDGVAGKHHRLRKNGGFLIVHSGKIYCHQKRGNLIIWNFSAHIAGDEKLNFLRRKLFSVALFFDNIIHPHLKIAPVFIQALPLF